MLRLAAMRCAAQCELVIAPCEAIESAVGEKRHYLERLGARAPVGDRRRLASRTDEPVRRIDHGGVNPVARLHEVTTSDFYIELEGPHRESARDSRREPVGRAAWCGAKRKITRSRSAVQSRSYAEGWRFRMVR